MKALVIFGTLLVGALVAGLIVWTRPTPATADVPAVSGANEERVAALERSVTVLQRRVTELEHGRVASPAEVAPDRVATRDPATPAAPPEIKEAVRAANEELRAEQMAEREQRREEMMRRRSEERAAAFQTFATEAGIDAPTQTKIRALLDSEETSRREFFRTARESGRDPIELRREARELRERTDQEVAKLLTEPQRAQYDAMRRQDRGIMFRGGPE